MFHNNSVSIGNNFAFQVRLRNSVSQFLSSKKKKNCLISVLAVLAMSSKRQIFKSIPTLYKTSSLLTYSIYLTLRNHTERKKNRCLF